MYEQFRGEVDAWVRSREGRSDPTLANDWPALGELIMNLRLSTSVPVSEVFRDKLEDQVARVTGGDVQLDQELRRVAEASKAW